MLGGRPAACKALEHGRVVLTMHGLAICGHGLRADELDTYASFHVSTPACAKGITVVVFSLEPPHVGVPSADKIWLLRWRGRAARLPLAFGLCQCICKALPVLEGRDAYLLEEAEQCGAPTRET